MAVTKQTTYDQVPLFETSSMELLRSLKFVMFVLLGLLLESGFVNCIFYRSLIYFLRECCLRIVTLWLALSEYCLLPWYSLI